VDKVLTPFQIFGHYQINTVTLLLIIKGINEKNQKEKFIT